MSQTRRKKWISVEVAYATPEKQRLVSLEIEEGSSALDAARQSGITQEFDAIDLDKDPMGIFSQRLDGKQKPLPADYVMREGDRVEIYRPLLIDPKSARVKRAMKAKKTNQQADKDGS